MLIKTNLSTIKVCPMGSVLGSIFLVYFEMLFGFQSKETYFLENVT